MTRTKSARRRRHPKVSTQSPLSYRLKFDEEMPFCPPTHSPPIKHHSPYKLPHPNMSHIPSNSEKSKVALKPQPAQRYQLLDVEQADEMEVDSLVTPKATTTADNPPTTQPESPTPQSTVGAVTKALPPGLNFSKAVTAGT